MNTNRLPKRLPAATLRVTLFPSVLVVVALSLLSAVSDDTSPKEDPAAPAAVFATATANPAANSSIQFASGSEGDATTRFWDFGDGSSSISRNPVHTYAQPGEYPVTLTVTNSRGSATSSRMLSVTASDTLRLIDSHPFDITLTATDPRTGATGTGQVVSQNDIYGIFSIPAITGNAGNPEVIVKMVDATGIGQSYWVFYGALTDLTYTLSVREAATGTTKSYNDAKVGSTVCGKFDTSGFGPPSAGAEPAVWSGVAPVQAQEEKDTLTLLSAHPFNIALTATDPRTGATGQGQVIAQNDVFGIFSLPGITGNAGNPEVIVKMVDASGIGQNYWVFYAALTDLNYTLAVEEAATGNTKTYGDAKIGTTVCGKFDTSGFVFTPTPPAPTPTPTPSPSPTPTAKPAAIVVNLVATDFQWSFNGAGSTFTMRVGQAYELHIGNGDPTGRAAHGFGGVPGLGIPAHFLPNGGPPVVVTFTPNASQTGTFFFACDQPSCGSGHSNMIGQIKVMP
jgi:PKD repeat protein